MFAKRLKMTFSRTSINEIFPRFLSAKTAQGISDKTLETYRSHFKCIGKHLDLSLPIQELTQDDVNEMVVSMRRSGLAHNSVSSYMRVFRTVIGWCYNAGYTSLRLPNIKDRETLKETYTDDELLRLLAKPKRDCDFTEYRNWVIVNLLMNSGCRAATVRNIRNADVSIPDRQLFFRHTKTGKIQVVPLCSSMCSILADYMAIRGGADDDYLFPNEFGQMMREDSFRSAIYRYNRKRGVQKTSLHLFRHTFARKFLVDCGGDAFTLQRLLGHSTLNMTKHYCSIYDADISKNFDRFSPLTQLTQSKEKLLKKR